jgi:small subunit ribosomal protein S2
MVKEEKVKVKEDSLAGAELEKAAEAESLKPVPKEVPSMKDVEGESKKESKPTPLGVPQSTELRGKTSKEDLKKLLLEKAAKLKSKVEGGADSAALKEEIKAKKKADMLVPLEEYVKTGIYLGTRVVTPDMKQYVYRRRADGLAIFNTDLIDEKLKEGVKYLSKFAPEDVILVCRRQSAWDIAKKFSEITGIRVFTKKYPAGILTNTQLDDFFENELTIITDHWLEKNALKDTVDMKKDVLMICGTNNFSKGANQVIIGNNKSPKSIGLIYYLLAKGYCKARGIEKDIPDMDWWIESDE